MWQRFRTARIEVWAEKEWVNKFCCMWGSIYGIFRRRCYREREHKMHMNRPSCFHPAPSQCSTTTKLQRKKPSSKSCRYNTAFVQYFTYEIRQVASGSTSKNRHWLHGKNRRVCLVAMMLDLEQREQPRLLGMTSRQHPGYDGIWMKFANWFTRVLRWALLEGS